MQPELLIATSNPGKIKEIKAILSPLNLKITTPKDLALNLRVAETGGTYLENALLKARAYYQAAGLPVLADDSGLEVDALDGAPGLHSARFSPKENANDADRRAYLLEQLSDKAQPWHAHFHCTAVLLSSSDNFTKKVGRCRGLIIPEERGNTGFGYDPVFYIPEYGATMAELGPDIKNKISHRAKALIALNPVISKLLGINELN
ncbi:MAG: RdgB/HAM1 family non-canonical purine NTP pyrophosphatase [Brevefilum sp.]|nr:RdgB/HAM1 family non-canonical purine NTP pyrophosphatase [Brevefilum sp.]MDT8381133.1 RdgB/HAM1 family non-canonical purine NTP pyrophosphatase [Brevefilum sp.]